MKLLLLLLLATTVQAQERPKILASLYLAQIGLQAADSWTTLRAINGGAREANPAMRAVAQRPAVLIAVKAATAAGTILIAERLWKRNRTAAVLMMVASNSAMGIVAWHNGRVR